MQTPFDLFEKRFVPWRDAGGLPAPVGLRKALERAGKLAPFGDAGPQTTFAVVRLLLVLMHLTRPKCNEQEWQSLWERGCFPADWLCEIDKAARGKFDLFDAERPFLQRARSAKKTRPASDLIAELPADTNINHSRHTYDDRVALCPACCVLGLLRLAPFCGQGGRGEQYGKPPSINAPPPVYFLPVGDTLFRTLLLNWPLSEPVDGDCPAWDDGKGEGQERIGLLEGFTWEPRFVRLTPPVDARGDNCTLCGRIEPQPIRRIIFLEGRKRDDPRLKVWRDPHVAYAEETGKKQTKQVRTLLPPEPIQDPVTAAGLWREIAAALLRSGHGDTSAFSSTAVAVARRFRLADDLTVLVVATHTRQAKVLHDRLDLWTLPPPDEQRDQTLMAELGWLADGLVKLPGLAPREEFERRAERHFRALLARRGEGISDWRVAIRADLRTHTLPALMPGRALDYRRAVRATEHTISTCFPMPEGTT